MNPIDIGSPITSLSTRTPRARGCDSSRIRSCWRMSAASGRSCDSVSEDAEETEETDSQEERSNEPQPPFTQGDTMSRQNKVNKTNYTQRGRLKIGRASCRERV